jgi:hypothetical protein
MARAKVTGVRDGTAVQLPPDLDAIVISTSIGDIYIDLEGQVKDMVLMRASISDPRLRLLLSPMDSGRLAVGVIKA